MKEWEKHLERAEEKLRSANLLFENKMFADAISEAYYAMFHAAKALLALKGIYPKTHAGVVSQFGLLYSSPSMDEFVNKKVCAFYNESCLYFEDETCLNVFLLLWRDRG